MPPAAAASSTEDSDPVVQAEYRKEQLQIKEQEAQEAAFATGGESTEVRGGTVPAS